MDIIAYIDVVMKSRGITKYTIDPIFVDVTKPLTILDLNKYVYVLASESIDTKIHTVVNLVAPDNSLRFNNTMLEQMKISKYKTFSEQLTIQVENFGSTLTPFRLEFLKVIPQMEKKEVDL